MRKIFKSTCVALSIATVALLSACGGGDRTANEPAWGSPAMFVPAGQSQINVAVSACQDTSQSRLAAASAREQPTLSRGAPVVSPTLVITSAGDVIFSGVVGTATVVTELVRLNFAATTDRGIDFNSDAARNGFYVSNDNGTNMSVDYDGVSSYFSAENQNHRINCNQVSNLTPAYSPSEARLAAKFTAGATSWANDSVHPFTTATIASSLITWNNQAVNTTLDPNQVSARYASLNLANGALNVGGNPNQVTQSVAISAATAAGGSYSEEDFTDPDFSQGRAKFVSLSISTASQGVLKFQAYTGDNIMIVTPSLGSPFSVPAPVIPAPL